MLVLSRRVGESIVIGDDVTVTVLEVRGDVTFTGPTTVRGSVVVEGPAEVSGTVE